MKFTLFITSGNSTKPTYMECLAKFREDQKLFPRRQTPAKMGRPAVQVDRGEIIHHELKSLNQLDKETSKLQRKPFSAVFKTK